MYALATMLIEANPLPKKFDPLISSEKAGKESLYTNTYRILLIDLEFRFQISIFTRILLATFQHLVLKSSSPSSVTPSFTNTSVPSGMINNQPKQLSLPVLTSSNYSPILHYYLQKLEIYRPRTSHELMLTLEYLSTQSKYTSVASNTNNNYRGSIGLLCIEGFSSSWLWQDRVGIPGMDKDIVLANLLSSSSSLVAPTSPSTVSNTSTITSPINNIGTFHHTSSLGVNHEQDYQRIATAMQRLIQKHRCRILWTRSFIFGTGTTNTVYQSSMIDLATIMQQYQTNYHIGQSIVSQLHHKDIGTLALTSTSSIINTDITTDDLILNYRDSLPKCLSHLVKYTILMNKLNYIDCQYIFSNMPSTNSSSEPINLFNLSSIKSELQQITLSTSNPEISSKKTTASSSDTETITNTSMINPQSLSIFIARLRSNVLSKSSSPVIPRVITTIAPYVVKECNIIYTVFDTIRNTTN